MSDIMTQDHLSWLIPLCGWLAFTARMFIWDGSLAEANTREFDKRDAKLRERA